MSSVRVGFFTPIHSLDPHDAQDYVGGQIIEQLYETPYRQISDDHPLEPLLFDGMLERHRSGTATRCVGRLREGLKFSDGSPVTAEDVVASLQLAQPIVSRAQISAAGNTVEFLMPEDDPRLEVALSRRWCSVVRRGESLLGTGPYRVRPGWKPEQIQIERNPYSRNPPKIDEVEFRVYPTDDQGRPEALIRAIQDGEVDFTTVLGRDDVGRLSGVRKVFHPGSSTAILYFNTENPVLASGEVRLAIAEAIDRQEIASVVYENPHAFVARSILPPSMWRMSDGIRFDRSSAKKRMLESGVLPSRPLRMLLMLGPRPYLPHPYRIADVVERQLGEIGIQIEQVRTESSVDHRAKNRAGDYDLALAGWMADTPDPYDFLAATLRADSIPVPDRPSASSNNLSRYVSGEMNEALERYRKGGRDETLREIMALLARDVPVCPLFYGPTIIVHAWRLRNVELTPVGMPLLSQAELD